MRRPFVCLLSLLCSPGLLGAQVPASGFASAPAASVQALPSHLTGRVLDATGGPIAGAAVVI